MSRGDETPPRGLRPVSGSTLYQLVSEDEDSRRGKTPSQMGIDAAALKARLEVLEREVEEKRQSRPPGERDDNSTTVMLMDTLRVRNAQLEEELRNQQVALVDRERKLSDERAQRDSRALKKPSLGAVLGLVATTMTILASVFAAAAWFTSTQIKLAAADPEVVKAREEQIEVTVRNRTTQLAARETVNDHEIRLVKMESTLAAIRDQLAEINGKLPPRRR